MKKLHARVLRKKEIFKLYEEHLSDLEEVSLFKHDLKNTSPWFIDSV